MFNRTPPPEDKKLREAIDDALTNLSPHSDTYHKDVEALETMYKLQLQNKPERVSRDTIALVLGNLAGVAMIVGHERAHVVGSKALSFIKLAR